MGLEIVTSGMLRRECKENSKGSGDLSECGKKMDIVSPQVPWTGASCEDLILYLLCFTESD